MSRNQQEEQRRRGRGASQRPPRTSAPATDRHGNVIPLTPTSDPRNPSQIQPYITSNVSGRAPTGGSVDQQSHGTAAQRVTNLDFWNFADIQPHTSPDSSRHAPIRGRSDRSNPQTVDPPTTTSGSHYPVQNQQYQSAFVSGFASTGVPSHPPRDLQNPPSQQLRTTPNAGIGLGSYQYDMHTSLPSTGGSILATAGMPQSRPPAHPVMTSSAGEGSRASTTSRKGKEKRIADSPPLEPESRRKGRGRSPPSDERPTKLVAIAPRSGANTQTAQLYSLPGGDLRRSRLCPEITEDQELKVLAEIYRKYNAKHKDIATRVGVTITHIEVLKEQVGESLKGKHKVEPPRRHCPEAELQQILSHHDKNEDKEIITKKFCRTIEDVTYLLMKVHLERGLGPVQDKPNTMKK